MDAALLAKFLRETAVVRGPKRTLATFGPTSIRYHLVSPVEDLSDRTRLREGTVESERPLILTAEALRERFEGFGEESREFMQWLSQEYRDLLRALEYKFRNRDMRTQVLRDDPRAVAGRVAKDMENRNTQDALLMSCPDGAWSLALMKFTLDQTARSFPGNLRDLDRRGLFDPGAAAARRRRQEIESLFARARTDSSARGLLAGKLEEYGLMPEFEDRFLSLFR